MMPSKSRKHKLKATYRKSAAAAKRKKLEGSDLRTDKFLQSGMTGFLVTCKNKEERFATIEVYRLLNQALEKFLRQDKCHDRQQSVQQGDIVDNQVDQDDDILKQLERENLTSEPISNSEQPSKRYNFNSTRTGVSNRLFITHSSAQISSTALAHIAYNQLIQQKANARSVLRLIPVISTCHADAASINRTVRRVWAEFVSGDGNESEEQALSSIGYRAKAETLKGSLTFLVAIKIANYDMLSRDDAIEAAVSGVRVISPSWRVSPSSPSVVLSITVVRTVACVSLLEDFDRYHKYNVSELVGALPSEIDEAGTKSICGKIDPMLDDVAKD